MTTFVRVADYEPEHEVAEKLLDMAREAGYTPAVVGVSRDDGLTFSVPDDVGAAFIEARPELWPVPLVDDDNDPATPPVRRRRKSTEQE